LGGRGNPPVGMRNPMIPLVYYTSKRKFMGEFVNRNSTIVASLVTVALILAFNTYLILASL
jgi:Mn2+/Fe2+ NRAMP family transporter